MPGVWQKMKKNKFWLIAGVAVIAVAAIGAAKYQATEQPALSVQTATVERGDIVSLVSATGTVKPVKMVDISSKISGLIKEIKVRENETAKAGQVLVLLDDEKLQTLVSQTFARLANAEANYQRNQKLNAVGAVSDQQLDAARMEYVVAKANHDDAVTQLGETIIKSPIDGTVIGEPMPAGQNVSAGYNNPMVILTVADTSKMKVETQVDETDIGKVILGQRATFTVDAYPGKTFTGVVSNISQKATISQNVIYYTVVIDVDPAQNTLLKPSMTARVSLKVGEQKNALMVPLAALKTGKDQQYLQVMRNGQVQNIPVTTGLTSDDKVEIVSGVSEGEQIVLSQIKKAAATVKSGTGGGSGSGMPRMQRMMP